MTDAYIKLRYTILDDGTAIRCERCHQVSHNIDDVHQLYCGHCNVFHEDGQLPIPPHIKAIAEGIAMDARATICQGGEVVPEIFVLNTTKELLVQPTMRMGELAEREQMAQETRLLADEMEADVVILLSEAWAQATKRGLAEMEALRAQYGGSIANMPARQEILLLTVETAGHYWSGRAPITGSGLDRRCGEVIYELADEERGRFTHFLATPAEKAQLAKTMDMVRAILGTLKVSPDTVVEYEGEQRSMLDTVRRVMVKNSTFVADPIRLGMAVAFLVSTKGK